MADFNNAVMTNEGAALLAQCEGGFAKMQFTAMVTGNGEYTEAEKKAMEEFEKYAVWHATTQYWNR